MVQRIGTVDSAAPHPDPSGRQAPALHFLHPPSAIGLQFGRFRRWRAGIEVDWSGHPGSESGTCFRTNRSCRLAPPHQGMKTGTAHTPLDSGLRRNDERGGGGIQALSRPRNIIFVPMTNWGAGRTTRLVSSHADRLGARIHSGFPTFRCSRRIGRLRLTGSTICRQAVQSVRRTTLRLLAGMVLTDNRGG